MRLQVIAPQGLDFGGRKYAQGEELEMPDEMRHARAWSAALIHNRQVKSLEPVVLGTAPPPPRRAPVESTPPLTAVQPITTQAVAPGVPERPTPPVATDVAPPPVFQPDEDEVVVLEEGEDDKDADPAKPRRGRPPIHGRYSRRDIRPEE